MPTDEAPNEGMLWGGRITVPSTYNKDLQESWEPMLDHVKTISDSVQITNGILATLNIRPERMLAAPNPSMVATDLAERLTALGVPFREYPSVRRITSLGGV
ncbi:hypothetical protein JX265_011802 [Neoarthrinium moseri]|uniref:Uncharacterized protein n=1 Tax=Neoarthrinium moseri TaxID=1658444 RepID=A0A9P9WBR6_9PEZI|nr:hypothetical protein JX266_013941 [Neoarthrinium moseri]KAI1856087.1 hypothetical protein JX265_011802 [Neoarthrinium moseri]